MSKGDVVSDQQDIVTGSDMDFQPAAGVEAAITALGRQSASSTDVQLYDGTLNNGVYQVGVGPTSPPKLLINNTRYLRFSNNSGANNELAFAGIQTK